MPMRQACIFALISSSFPFGVLTSAQNTPSHVQTHEVDRGLGQVEADRSDLLQYALAG